MKYRVIKLLGIATIGMMSVVGCNNTQNEEPVELQTKLEAIQQENQQLKEQVATLEEQVKQLTIENENLVQEAEVSNKQEYVIYNTDIDTYAIKEEDRIEINEEISMQEKIQQVANTLSNALFSGLSIDVQEVKVIDGQEIARINLSEVEGNEMTWISHYFQGSTGAMITRTSLEETLLQRNNTVEWVDGIELVYEGESLDMDHVNLEGIIYR